MSSEDAVERPLLSDDDDDGMTGSFLDASFYMTSIWRLRLSFFLFGTINNVLYVIILSAALDLVPSGTPKGIIAFCNIAPALVAKVGWPYLLKGRVLYKRRIIMCCFLSVLGMIVVAAFDTLGMRLLGIALASLSSGLGELTFLQLSTTYRSQAAGQAVGYFASGTGAAGLLGAALWWMLRGLGVREGVGVSSVLPFIIPLAYGFILPSPTTYDDHEEAFESQYGAVPTTPETESASAFSHPINPKMPGLSAAEKWVLVKPLIFRYMLPLFSVYTFEYTINQGISPTLLYPVPKQASHPILSLIIKSLRDYYPLWQLIYQAFVFLSRSSISLGVPPLPKHLLPAPTIMQGFILLLLWSESAYGVLPENEGRSIPIVMFFVALEGLCGGLAYVTAFYQINQEGQSKLRALPPNTPPRDLERFAQEREFQIGSIGLADSMGILLASLIAMPTEVGLCRMQVARGRNLCREV